MTNAISKMKNELIRFLNHGDYCVQLQSHSSFLELNLWTKALKSYNSILSKKRTNWLYIIYKLDNLNLKSVYIGITKHTQGSFLNRLEQHIQGLNVYTRKDTKHINYETYERWFSSLCDSDKDLPINLSVYRWEQTTGEKEREIGENILHGLKFNLANAESVLISYIGKLFPSAIINRNYIGRKHWQEFKEELQEKEFAEQHNIGGESPSETWETWVKWFLDEKDIPLFMVDKNKIVKISEKSLFIRHPLMEKKIEKEAKIVFDNYQEMNQPSYSDGLIYMIYWKKENIKKNMNDLKLDFTSDIIPLYIGKTEAIGRNGGYSANLKNVHKGRNKQYFARWGDDYARHIGALSSGFYKGVKRKGVGDYESWIERLFVQDTGERNIPLLKYPIYFNIKAWKPNAINILSLEKISTASLEAIIIALARHIFEDILINKKGR